MNTYKRHRFPSDIISYAVWLYYRFNLSHRDIEDLLAERGITVTRESIRLWCLKYGVSVATAFNKPTPNFPSIWQLRITERVYCFV
jgi:transposase-like protein